MFTGIVENLGTLKKVEELDCGLRFSIHSTLSGSLFSKGTSILVNGVCLTVESYDENSHCFTVTLVDETLKRTAFNSAKPGQVFNLESSLTLQKPLAGHLVLGHVDFTAEVIQPAPYLELAIPSNMMKYFPEKGSVTVHGVSLTTAERTENGIVIALIPETLRETNLANFIKGERVHIEIDVLARYLETLLSK